MSKIYTKTGDKGETSLVNGSRVFKGDIRIDTYGEVDELNSYLGVISSHINEIESLSTEVNTIHEIQNNLFNLGSNLACESSAREKFKLPSLCMQDISFLERKIDEYTAQLEPLKNFILPGGSKEASFAHIARTVCRRVERKLVIYNQSFPAEMPEYSIEYINRLSDYLFSLARFMNLKLNKKVIVWKIK